jgi:hypothetical protein
MKDYNYLRSLLILSFFSLWLPETKGQILDKQTTLDQFLFWTNKDWDWYKENIPFLETPDQDIDLTYYYRWEMMSGKIVYGSPESGYASTEFTDRPWWSGPYGAISCPAGHQLYEFRWFIDKKYAEDYTRYWFRTPGAQPRNYTTWIGDAAWQIYKVYGNEYFVTDLQDDLIDNYKKWEEERYVPSEGMFAWDGMHDGMETNINSRQTENWFSGAPGYRPTINSYMWADALAISNIALLKGDRETAEVYRNKAEVIKTNLQEKTWDPERNFFFHRFKNDEDDGIKANTLTYQTGKYAGSSHGREEMGYVPWYFKLPDAGFESAWQYLMDPDYFYTPYGPTTVEQQDPLFKISPRCCEWSGNAWPFATSQTLKAMANLIKYYDQNQVSKDDYVDLLRIYARTHRKDGKPYIAEANHPITGSWSGHDVPNHSEHYFHSSYIDLVITGLIGLEPMESDSVEVDPLIPDDWDYFALDNVHYHGQNLSVIWDRNGERYNKGKGLLVIADGKIIASSPEIKRLVAYVDNKASEEGAKRLVNYAVNNQKDQYFPRAISSFAGIGDNSYLKITDGQYWYYTQPANRWSSLHSTNKIEYVGIDFGIERPIQTVKLYIYEDDSIIKAPESFDLEYWDGKEWNDIPGQVRNPFIPEGGRANTIDFKEIYASKLRAVIKPKGENKLGVSEFEAWGRGEFPIKLGSGEIKNLAYHTHATFSCSFASKYDQVAGVNNGLDNPTFRWTAFESPNKTDWIQFDFDSPKSVNQANLFVFDDNGGIRPPRFYTVQFWDGSDWVEAKRQKKIPKIPHSQLNQCLFDEIKTSKIRIVFTHPNPESFSGIYELELYGFN